jgi:hypothetical protein
MIMVGFGLGRGLHKKAAGGDLRLVIFFSV